jgi:hypothetical protein
VGPGECLAYALADDQLQGVWGGTSEAERRVLRRATEPALEIREREPDSGTLAKEPQAL